MLNLTEKELLTISGGNMAIIVAVGPIVASIPVIIKK